MERQSGRSQSVLRSLDWWTIGIYLALLAFGWISVCGASYTYGDTDIFSLDTRSGMQIIWIGTSIVLGFVILMLEDWFYDTFSYVIFSPPSSIRIKSKAHAHGLFWVPCVCNPPSSPSSPRRLPCPN